MNWFNYWGCIPVTGKIKKKDWANVQNSREFNNTFMVFYTLALELYKWSGLPDTCDERMLERYLLLNGQAMIADVNGAYLTLASAGGSDINLYGYPTQGFGYGLNGFNQRFNLYVPGADDSKELLTSPAGNLPQTSRPEAVVCYDNAAAYPYILYIMQDALRLSDLVRSADVAVKTLKSPIIIGVNETERSSMKQLMEDYEDNVFAILTAKGFSLDSIQVWPTNGNPQTIEAIWNQYLNVWARLLGIFGLNSNPNEDKKERLLVDEVNANNQYITSSLYKRLAWRKNFCEQVNRTFGLNISVDINPEVKEHVSDDSYGRPEDDLDNPTGGGDSDSEGDS